MSAPSSKQLNLVYRAISDPTRRAILDRLAHGEARVTSIARRFPMTLHAVSKHIQVLERAGMLRRRRHGREHVLSIDSTSLDAAAIWISQQQKRWAQRLDALEELLRAEDKALSVPRKRRPTR